MFAAKVGKGGATASSAAATSPAAAPEHLRPIRYAPTRPTRANAITVLRPPETVAPNTASPARIKV